MTDPVSPAQPPKFSVAAIASGFEPTTVRCASEARLTARIEKDADFFKRIQSLTEERERSLVQGNLSLLTECYRVDPALTPKLDKLRELLRSVLRLVQPIDVYIQPSADLNAFCIASRKGTRLVMCLNSGLVEALSGQELLFVMGHEVGHALLGHVNMPKVPFGHPEFSLLEVIRLRALERRREISCDRMGLLACQDVKAACSALFRIASGLSNKWVSFEEGAYARHFDDISGIAELTDLDNAAGTHPIVPLRVKALIAFSKSELFAKAFGEEKGEVATEELEKAADHMLSVLEPDLTELEGANENEAANRLLCHGALFIVAADGTVEPSEIEFLKARMKVDPGVIEAMSKKGFFDEVIAKIQPDAALLCRKLSVHQRVGVLRHLCQVALSSGSLANSEVEALSTLRKMLEIPEELFGRELERTARQAGDAKPTVAGKGKGKKKKAAPAAPEK